MTKAELGSLHDCPRGQVISVVGEVLAGDARGQAWQQVITTAPNYANYEKQTTREIPLVLLHP